MNNASVLAVAMPDLAAKWHPTKNGNLCPTDVTCGSGKRVWWLWPYDVPDDYYVEHLRGKHFEFEWENSIRNQVKTNECPYLSKYNPRIWVGFNDLVTTHPELAEQWHPIKNGPLTPKMVTDGSNKKVWWLMRHRDTVTGKNFDFEWQAIVANRVKQPTCPYLVGKYVKIGFNDLATTHPTLAKEWHPTKNGALNPTHVTAGSDKKVWWLLPYDDTITGKHFEFEWEAKINNRSRGKGCPFLFGRAVWPGFNDLSSKYPDICLEWNYNENKNLLPQEISYGSGKKVWWKCSNGHKWISPVCDRVGGKGCPVCAESKGEKIIHKVLEDSKISFKEQYKFTDRFWKSSRNLLRDDFAIFDNSGNIVATIEYHGIQHYEPIDFAGKGKRWAQKEFEKTKERDHIKTKYMQVHNIPQLIVPYWEIDNADTIVSEFIDKLITTHDIKQR